MEEKTISYQYALEQFRDLKSIARIKTRRRRTLITHMTDKYGAKRTTRQDIADVFAKFYEHLYNSTAEPTQQERPDDDLSPFTRTELDKAISGLRLGKAPTPRASEQRC